MTAKEFLLTYDENSVIAERVGAKMMLTVDEAALLLERYKNTLPRAIQVCPKCDGEGQIPNTGMMSTSLFRKCPVCLGDRYFKI